MKKKDRKWKQTKSLKCAQNVSHSFSDMSAKAFFSSVSCISQFASPTEVVEVAVMAAHLERVSIVGCVFRKWVENSNLKKLSVPV